MTTKKQRAQCLERATAEARSAFPGYDVRLVTPGGTELTVDEANENMLYGLVVYCECVNKETGQVPRRRKVRS